MSQLVSLIPLFPLVGFVIIALLGKKLPKNLAGVIGSLAVLASFVISVLIFLNLKHGESTTVKLFDWISAGNFSVSFSFLVDPLSSLFLLVITGVGFLIHLYSIGYMHHDEGFARFFAYLNLFVFFMLLLVLGDNYLIMFVGWEGVGLCSYLLIGFWFKNTDYNNAAKKAFIINRIGDLGFVLGIILIFVTFGSITYKEVFSIVSSPETSFANTAVMTSIGLLLFIGAMGKSAQLPLYTWLPDAMAGPTPVSALIHAATMVTAGIYMVARSNILYAMSDTAMTFVAVVGLITALFAATIGLFQNDIKKVLAYSTVSQLGYMFLALGIGAFSGAVFHVMTHAFFKALLFLCAGSVIHAMSGEQDIRNMGGLKKHLPITHLTFLIGTLAIAGVPPFSGFFSKDEILAHAYAHSPVLWFGALLGAILTAFYMFRLYYLTFYGNFRGTEKQMHHMHESPASMTIPLIILAILATVGGFIGMPEIFHTPHFLNDFLSPVFADAQFRIMPSHLSHSTEWTLIFVTLGILIAVLYFVTSVYLKKKTLPAASEEEMSFVQKLIYNKYYVDELYENLITKPLNATSDFFYKIMELKVVDGIVNGVGTLVVRASSVVRLLQTGHIGFYIFAMVASILAIFFFKMF